MKKFLNSSSISNFFYVPLFFAVLMTSCKNQNDHYPVVTDNAIAFAYPMTAITLDGDLSEWPDNMARYPISNAELGDAPENREDFLADFRIGYNAQLNEVYVAMNISDESVVVETAENSFWNNQDGLELYLNQGGLQSSALITQYSEYGNDRNAYGAGENWDNVEMKKKKTKSGKTVEWKINLDEKIKSGMSLGFDLVALDKDNGDSFTWVSWAKGTQKLANPDRLGNVLFVNPGTDIALVKGKVDTSELHLDAIPLTVRLTRVDNKEMKVQTAVDSLGNYSAPLPVGDYEIEIPTKVVENEYRYFRLAPSASLTVLLRKNGHEPLPNLVPRILPEPDLIPANGLLHEFGPEQENQVDEIINAYRKHYNIPGVSLALIKEGKVAYHKTYGVKNVITQEAVDDKTLFEAASITKPVFAFAVLKLADQGVIDLDKPLHEYLPFEQLEKYPEYKKMTARHVLIHRTGLPNWGIEMINIPGEKYGYSGEGFEYLKRVVVAITKKPIEQILDEELIAPNELYHMEFSDSESLRKVVSDGHIGNNPSNWDIPQEAGMAFSMHTEAKAFAKYALAILERKGLKPSTYKEFLTIHTESKNEYWNVSDKPEGAGLGIFIRKTDYGDTFYHGGNNGDFKCQFEVYDKLKMGYIIYTNSDTGSELTTDAWQIFVEGKKKADKP